MQNNNSPKIKNPVKNKVLLTYLIYIFWMILTPICVFPPCSMGIIENVSLSFETLNSSLGLIFSISVINWLANTVSSLWYCLKTVLFVSF